MATVLIVDDAADLTFSLATLVRRQGYASLTADTGSRALEMLRTNVIDLVFLDIGLPDISGVELIPQIRDISNDSEIIMLTGANDAKTAVESLKAGAADYIVKPFDIIEFTNALEQVMRSRLMHKQVLLSDQGDSAPTMIGTSRAMQPVQEALAVAAEVDSPVLITGETGTGKELAARAIHAGGRGRRGVFVKVDCGTLAANLIESELFGHEKGAFTDAGQARQGLVEIADGGTLFLDEIGNLPPELQPKLLRLIAESTFRRVGSNRDVQVSLRIIAATNTDLKAQMEKGRFRRDLFYRLNVIPVALPPLRRREGDILLLADYYLHFFNRELKKNIKGFTEAAIAALMAHSWPGNIRELRNRIEREMIFCKSDWLQFGRPAVPEAALVETEPASLREVELAHIRTVLKACQDNKSKAARILGITRTTLRARLESD